MIESGFWRGYWPLLVSIGSTQLVLQVDIVTLGWLGGDAQSAYVLLTRLSLLDLVLMTAMGTVASTIVAQRRRTADGATAIGGALFLSAIGGLFCGLLGFMFYPRLAALVAGEGEVAAQIETAIYLYTVATPLRFSVTAAILILHALDEGVSIVRWKLIEGALKIGANLLFIGVLGSGLRGCFASGLVVAIVSSIWCWRLLSSRHAAPFHIPSCSLARNFFRSTAWESQRTVAVHFAVTVGVMLFAAPWLGHYDISRLSAYAAGQTLMLLVFAPLLALTRFLSFRLARVGDDVIAPLVRALWLRGAPVSFFAALVLFTSRDLLGDLYGQQGPWWSSLIVALAASLPLRHAANVTRAALLSRGAFAEVAKADSVALWSCAVPLLALGLAADSPPLTYTSLIVPEAICALWLWRRLTLPRNSVRANAAL